MSPAEELDRVPFLPALPFAEIGGAVLSLSAILLAMASTSVTTGFALRAEALAALFVSLAPSVRYVATNCAWAR